MLTTLSILSFITIGFALLCGLLIPVSLGVFIRKRFQTKIFPFFAGCLTFFVFAITFEGFVNVFISSSSFGEVLQNNRVLFALYGGIMAGLFEEIGRYIVMLLLKKNNPDSSTALMFGAGHASMEVFLVLVITMFTNFALGVMLNNGFINEMLADMQEEEKIAIGKTIETLCTTNPALFLVSVVERIGAVIFHISASVLVWFSVQNIKNIWLLPLAIILHALMDFIAGIGQTVCENIGLSAGVSIFIVEVFLYIFVFAVAILSKFIWNKFNDN